MATAVAAPPRATYRDVLAEPRFRVLFATRSLAIAADTLRILALSVLVFGLTRSPLLASVTFGIGFAPQAIGGTLLGAVSDRVPPKLLIVGGYLLEAGTAAVLALAGLPVAANLALVAVIACLTPLFGGASSRLVAQVLTGDAYVLGRSLANIAASAAQLLGLAMGGAIVATLGARHALLVTAGCHLAAAGGVQLWLPRLPATASTPAGQQRRSVVRQSLAGSRRLLTDPAVRTLLLANWLPPAFITGAEGLIVPYAAVRRFPAGSAGLLMACLPVGMLAGDLIVGRLMRPATRERLTMALMLTAGLPLVIFAAGAPLGVVAVLLVVTGFCLAYELGIQRRFLESVPAPILGQGFGLLSTGLMTLQGVGPAVFGAMAGVLSAGHAMAVAGVATAATALALRRRLAA